MNEVTGEGSLRHSLIYTVYHGTQHGCVSEGPWRYYSSPRSVFGYVNKNWDPQIWRIPTAGRISAVYVSFW